MTSHTEKFIKTYGPVVVRDSIASGVPASITMAQAILESGWGKQAICNNMFGIKSHNWSGPVCNSGTTEWGGSSYIGQVSSFRAYPTPYESFKDHSNFLEENSRYSFLYNLNPMDYKLWAKGLKQAGYATAPDYDSKLINVIEQYHLQKLDLEVENKKMYMKLALGIFIALGLLLLFFIVRRFVFRK